MVVFSRSSLLYEIPDIYAPSQENSQKSLLLLKRGGTVSVFSGRKLLPLSGKNVTLQLFENGGLDRMFHRANVLRKNFS
jgi:hypothetical protein